MKRFGSLILALLRELADENAYQRHLAAHGRAHSAEEWRRFSKSGCGRSTRARSAAEAVCPLIFAEIFERLGSATALIGLRP